MSRKRRKVLDDDWEDEDYVGYDPLERKVSLANHFAGCCCPYCPKVSRFGERNKYRNKDAGRQKNSKPRSKDKHLIKDWNDPDVRGSES